MLTTEDGTQIDPKVLKVMKAIKHVESGGKYDAVGDSGTSKGAYQWHGDNWKTAAKTVLGDENAEMSPANQNKVAYHQIKAYKDQGLQPEEIAARWNGAHIDKVSGRYVYNNPEYGTKFRAALGQVQAPQQQGGYQTTATLSEPTGVSEKPEDRGFLGNVASDLSHRLGQAGEAISGAFTGKMSAPLISAPLQVLGAGAGAVTDVLGEGLRQIPGVKQAQEAIGGGIGAAAQTGIGQGLINAYQGLPEELRKDIGAGLNVGLLAGGGFGGAAAKAGIEGAAVKGILGSTAKGMADRSFVKAAAKALESVPGKKDVISGIKGERLSINKGVPSMAVDPAKEASIKQVAEEMKNGLIPKKGLKTEVAIGAEKVADNEAKSLEKALSSSSDVIPEVQPEQINSMLQNVIKRAGSTLTSGENPAQTLIQKFLDQLPKKGPVLPVDILKARRAVGQFVRENRGDWSQRGILTGFKSARDAFWDESRDLLKTVAPKGVDVEGSLAKQAALYRVADYIAPGVKGELGTTRFGRFGTRHPRIKGLLKGGTKMLATGALTGLGIEGAHKYLGD